MTRKFNDYKLSPEILKSLELLNYTKPTKVQSEVIPTILSGEDLIVKSQTGSGKTAAFGIPLCELLEWEENKPQALVLTPTRELAMQVKEEIFNIGRYKRIKACAVFGKAPFHVQARELKQKMHVVVGTPGRVIDHMEQKTFDTSKVKYLIIDEADEMLNMGFIEQLHEIITNLPNERVTLLFSATIPEDIKTICDQYMNAPKTVEIADESPAIERIDQLRYDIDKADKFDLLRDLTILENPDTCMIFCNTRILVDQLHEDLEELKYSCGKIHGGMLQRDRMRVMNNFKKGHLRYLIATGVAARGIDVDKVSLVINFDIPEDPESYVHRIGRTGRKGLRGRAITLVTNKDAQYLKEIEEYTGKSIPLQEFPTEEAVEEAMEAFEEKMSKRPEVKEQKGAKLNADILKIHINAGKKQKMRAADIVGTLCNIEGMTKDDIGVINILDISTYFEVLHGKGEMVFKALQQKPLKGRLRKVSKAEDELWPGEKAARRRSEFSHNTKNRSQNRDGRRRDDRSKDRRSNDKRSNDNQNRNKRHD